MRSVLVDASNLHGGGGVQVAASFLDELAELMGDPIVSARHPWLADVVVEMSSTVRVNVAPATISELRCSVVDRRPKNALRYRNRRFAVSFVIFGPEFGTARARKRVVGFGDSTVTHRRPPGVRLASAPHRVKAHLRAAIARQLFRSADVLVVETEHTADEVAAKIGACRERIEVVPNTYNRVFDDPSKWDDALSLPQQPDGGFLLAYIARAYPHKNFDLLGRIGATAKHQFGQNLKFLVTLDQQDWKNLPEPVRHYAHNFGPVSISTVPRVYQLADAAIFPSLLESFSVMPLEAFKMGVTVFASDREFVRTTCGDAPIYFDPLDPVSATTTLVRSLANPQLMNAHVLRGGQVVEALPTARERATRYLQIIDGLLKEIS